MVKTGNKNFWLAQGVGWSLFALSNLIVQYLGGIPLKLLLINSILPLVIGLAVTSLFRHYIKDIKWRKLSFLRLVALIIMSSLVQAVIVMVLIILLSELIFSIQVRSISQILSSLVIFTFVLLVWNLIYFLIHFFNTIHNAEVEKWQLLTEVKNAQLGSLKSQINPHFVFNAINNIRALILEDKDKARDMLLNFSDLFRYSLKHSDNTKVTLAEEIEIVNQYLELLSIQYEDKLGYKLDIAPELLDQEVPPMLIQMLVENAIKHGVSQQLEGGVINIDIFENSRSFIMEVRNTGSLKTKLSLGERLGVGLENIRERLRLMYDNQASFAISDNENLVTATIKIPLQ